MGHRPQLSWGSLTHLEARGRLRQQHLRLPGNERDQVMGWGWLDQVRDPGNHSPYVSLVMHWSLTDSGPYLLPKSLWPATSEPWFPAL